MNPLLGSFLCLLLLLLVTSVSTKKAPLQWAGLRLLNEYKENKESITTMTSNRHLHIPHQQHRRRRNGEVKGSSYKKKKDKSIPRDKLEKGETSSQYASSSYKMRTSAYKDGGGERTKDRCGMGRKNTNITTTFDVDKVDEVYLDSGHSGMRFQFGGDYNGTWIQTIVRINDAIRIGHDQLTFYDKDTGALVGVLATQFDSALDYAHKDHPPFTSATRLRL
jgi:hypothetical protein